MDQLTYQQLRKISSFSNEELADWIKNRLKGNDPHFPVKKEDEIMRYDMLLKSFYYMTTKPMQDEFLKILVNLTDELVEYTPEKYHAEKEYIYELNYLCRFIDRLDNKQSLYTLAVDDRLKKIYAYGYNLHLELLKTLSDEPVFGEDNFWIQILRDRTLKKAHLIALSALRKAKYNSEIFVDLIEIYFDLVKNPMYITMDFAELIYNHGDEKVRKQIQSIAGMLYNYQKQAINLAFGSAGKPIPF
jgi:hypothetical protein